MADCPCDDGDPDLPAGTANYAHAAVIDAFVYPPPRADEYAQVLRCRRCDAVWWVRVHEFDQLQTDRDGLPTGSSLHRVDTNGLRCRDLAEAEALTPWYPLLRDAERRFRDADERSWKEPGPERATELIAIQSEFAALLIRHPQAGQLLAYGNLAPAYLNWQPSALIVRATAARRTQLIGLIEAGDGNAALRQELADLQARCATARASDPHMDHDSVTLGELWTPDLAVVPALEQELAPLRIAARETSKDKQLDAHGLARLHAIRKTLAGAWRAFHRKARWPSPEVEFRLLLDYLCHLEPDASPDVPDAWDEPERVAFRLRTLMRQHDLLPARDVVIVAWVAKLLDIPQTSLDPLRPFWRPPRPVRWSQRRT